MNVSVIVTTYNSPRKLERVLGSLFLQTTLPGEIIIADDGSTEDTRSLITALTPGSPAPLHHLWQEDQGFRAARARNLALRHASGEYVVLLDGDCMADQHFIEDHIKLAEPGFFVQGKRVLVNREAEPSFRTEDLQQGALHLLGMGLSGKLSNVHHVLRAPWFPPRRGTSHRGIKTCNFGLFLSDAMAVNGFNEAFTGWGREDSEFAVRLYHYGLRRKDHPFAAICFHLWHEEAARDTLPQNDRMLEEAIRLGEYRCREGIEHE